MLQKGSRELASWQLQAFSALYFIFYFWHKHKVLACTRSRASLRNAITIKSFPFEFELGFELELVFGNEALKEVRSEAG